MEAAKARKELILEYEPVSVLMTVPLILLAPASLSVLIRSSCPQIAGDCDRINGDGGVTSFKVLLLS